jgi:hypothetical protein
MLMAILASLLHLHTPKAAGAQSASAVNVQVFVEHTERVKQGIRVNVRVLNRGLVPVFLETGGGQPWLLHSVAIDQLRAGGAWNQVGPVGDTPPGSVMKLDPSKSASSELFLFDPVPARFAHGKSIPMMGTYRARVLYYLSEQEWRAYRDAVVRAVHQNTKLPPSPAFAVSGPFEVSPR